jgi:peptidoglycan biosynthesis protein MviN/MurJ (putative lipid II flippase)
VLLRQRLGHAVLAGLGAALLSTTIATVCMAVVVLGISHLLAERGDGLLLLVSVPAGTAVYIVAARLLRIEMLSLVWMAKAQTVQTLGSSRE